MKNMKRIILILILMLTTAMNVFASAIPDGVKGAIQKDYPKADFRFDGVIILPDGTLYLPLYPALVKKPESIEIKKTYPENKKIIDKPDVVIFNNDFVIMKVLIDKKDKKTVLSLQNPPIEVRTGLLPQDMLVPKGLIIPENIKGIIGNLQIATDQDAGLRTKPDIALQKQTLTTSNTTKNLVSSVPQLQNKLLYIMTCYSKNIQVVGGENKFPEYALAQTALPYDMEIVGNDKFLLVTNYGKTFVNVVSLADERVIKQVDLTTPAGEIVVDRDKNKAYVASPEASSIYVIDLNTMTLKQKIKIKGMCEKLYLSQDYKKLFYADKKTNDIWSIELDNNFIIKNIGKFPNVSKISFLQNKVYIISRTKSHMAIVDYATLAPIKEIKVATKPIDMIEYKNSLYILGAQDNIIQILNTITDEITDTIYLNTKGFSTKICKLKNSNLAIITDTKAGKYSVLDLDKKIVIKTNPLEIPVSKLIVADRIKKISK